jgi:hypothetical protein
MRLKSPAVVCSLLFMLGAAGCGGGGYGGGSLVTTASPGGIWAGTDSATGLQVRGIVDESGQFHFIRSDLAQFVGTASTMGNSVTANFEGFTQVGTSFDDHSTHGTGSLTGTVAERSSLALSYQFTTDAGTASNGTLNLSYNSLYDVDSSLAAISGNYTDASSGNTVSVSGSGAITSQDPVTLCVVNGQVSIIDAMYNAYAVTYEYSNCTGTSAALNGVQFSGLATLNNGGNPVQAIIAVTGQAASTELALVLTLDHQ